MNNISFTGHRDVSGEKVKCQLRETLTELIANGSYMFFAGGAAGFDTLAAKTVLDLRALHPWITLTLILPCPPDEQTRSFSSALRQEYFEIMKAADNIEIISQHYTNGCMKQRNQRLIDCADICVCYYNDSKFASGTGQTVRMAQKKGIDIINLFRAE